MSTDQKVFRFDVSVDDALRMEVLDGARQVVQHAARVLLRVLGRLRDGVEQISALRTVVEEKQNSC